MWLRLRITHYIIIPVSEVLDLDLKVSEHGRIVPQCQMVKYQPLPDINIGTNTINPHYVKFKTGLSMYDC